MWKPFLARSLRSAFGGRRHAVPPGGADGIFSRAYTSSGSEAGGGEGTSRLSSHHRQQLQPPRRHLYVVLNNMGYSFHKLNFDDALLEDTNGGASEGNGMDNGAQDLRRLPDPILRIGSRRIGVRARIHALGRNIVITGAAYRCKGVMLVYDTDAAELEIGEDPPDEVSNWVYDAVAAGDKLHALQIPHYLRKATLDPMAMEGTERWTWACDGRSPMPMFPGAGAGYRVTAHALHPDGRTVFVSVEHYNPGLVVNKEDQAHDTLSLDTESGEWTHRGNWRLPFHGQGHYDGDLEAWVGVALGSHDWPPCKDHYLCSCDVPDLMADSSAPPPATKICENKLTFIEAPLISKGQDDPLLVHTGHGRLCLVEAASSPEQATDGCLCYRCALRVTMFRPKYGKNGELVMAARPRAARSYVISSAAGVGFHGPAFWM